MYIDNKDQGYSKNELRSILKSNDAILLVYHAAYCINKTVLS